MADAPAEREVYSGAAASRQRRSRSPLWSAFTVDGAICIELSAALSPFEKPTYAACTARAGHRASLIQRSASHVFRPGIRRYPATTFASSPTLQVTARSMPSALSRAMLGRVRR